MCSLTFNEPYYDCTEIWIIFLAYGELDVLCGENTGGCVFYDWKFIFVESKNVVDVCGRGTLQHELLHLKYDKIDRPNVIHNYSNCVMW